jgi:hypothetical protein
MAILFLPRVSEDDYPWLEATLRCHRDYAGWLKLTAEWSLNARSEGSVVRHITVKPDEFRRYLDNRALPYDLNNLLTFTDWVGRGRPLVPE